jgi:Mg-chelatase subunit ChlD
MDGKNKSLAKRKILSMQPENLTYLWSGMRLPLDQFSGSQYMTAALKTFTDGQPNERLSNGVIAAMRRWCKERRLENRPIPIHTFGFGYNLQDGLLQSIAELGGGDYIE